MVFLLAPTVPSAPRPKKTALVVRADSMSRSVHGRLVPQTSSTMPTVNRGRGCGAASSVRTAATMPGVNSLDPSP
jgi:hypothetical protein